MPNPMTVPALKRLIGGQHARLVAQDYREVGTHRWPKFDKLDVYFQLAPNTNHVIHIEEGVARVSVRQNIKDTTPRPFLEGAYLNMQAHWLVWKPSDITLTDEDVNTLEALALNGVRTQRWEPDWRLYGAGMIDVEFDKMRPSMGITFITRLSELGARTLEKERGMSLDGIRQERAQQAAEEEARLAERHIRMSPRYGDGRVDFTTPALPTLLVTYEIAAERLHFVGSIRGREDINTHLNSSLFGEFMIGVDALLGPAARGERVYYDMNDMKVKEGN